MRFFTRKICACAQTRDAQKQRRNGDYYGTAAGKKDGKVLP